MAPETGLVFGSVSGPQVAHFGSKFEPFLGSIFAFSDLLSTAAVELQSRESVYPYDRGPNGSQGYRLSVNRSRRAAITCMMNLCIPVIVGRTGRKRLSLEA